MTLPAVPVVGCVLDNRYELVKEIGRGGCAIVFEAHDLRLGRAVAIKVPVIANEDSTKASRFARESRVIASIQHPNVCAALDNGVTKDGLQYLVMERLFGESLRISAHRARFGINEAINLGLQLLSALDAVHSAGIVHRDVKPDNVILISRGGCTQHAKLVDFGLCRRISKKVSSEETFTREGSLIGTPEYMAPEQVVGSKEIDVRIDIYACGLLLYEVLTGERVFLSRHVKDTLDAVLKKKITPLRVLRPEAPYVLEALLERAMERNPRDRPQTAAEFLDDLLTVKEEHAAARARRESDTISTYDSPEIRPLHRSSRR